MNQFFVYILFSSSSKKFYVGHTNDINRRLSEHNSGFSKSTKHGIPWSLVFSKEFPTRTEAMAFESMIKKRGIRRFLDSLNSLPG